MARGTALLFLLLTAAALAAGTPRFHHGQRKESAHGRTGGEAANLLQAPAPPAPRRDDHLIGVTYLFLSIVLFFYFFGV